MVCKALFEKAFAQSGTPVAGRRSIVLHAAPMSSASRRRSPTLLLAAVASVVSLLGAVALMSLFGPQTLRRDAARLLGTDDAGRAEAERAILVNDPSICPVCGVVETVRPYEIRAGTASPSGGAAGAEANLVPRTAYRVTVRMEDGSYRTLSLPRRPAFKAGDQVRIADGAVAQR